MFSFKNPGVYSTTPLLRSQLYSDQTFYKSFVSDLKRACQSIVIESPFITTKRLNYLLPDLAKAVNRGVRIVINTRDPIYHDEPMQQQAAEGITALQELDITVLFTGNHHRKLAIVDDQTLWEGSLNILSQNDSCEVMRRIESPELVDQMIRFTGLKQWYT